MKSFGLMWIQHKIKMPVLLLRNQQFLSNCRKPVIWIAVLLFFEVTFHRRTTFISTWYVFIWRAASTVLYWHDIDTGSDLRHCIPFASICVHPLCLVGSLLLIVYAWCGCFVCFRPVSCVPTVDGISELPFLDSLFCFL